MNFRAGFLSIATGFLVWSAPVRAINNDQVDTFEDGTNRYWVNGLGDLTVATGGPGGPGDHYLEIDAMGFSSLGSKMVGFNTNQWTGNFIAAGVNAVEMDLKAISIDPISGISALTMRIAFRSATGPLITKGVSGYVSTNSVSLPVDGQWHHAVFNFSSLVPINSTNDGSPPAPLGTFLTAPPEFRIFHLVNPNAVIGDIVKAKVGIDNIHAFTNVKIQSTVRVSAGTIRLQGKGVPNTTYTIQSSPDLAAAFTTLGTTVTAANGTFQFDDNTVTGVTQRFYRIKTPLAPAGRPAAPARPRAEREAATDYIPPAPSASRR